MSDTVTHDPPPDVTDLPEAEPVIEGEAEPRADVVLHKPSAPAPTRQALMPLDANQVVAGMEAYQALLPRLLEESDYQDAGSNRRFVKKSGWRKIARAFNLSVELVSIRVERDGSGQPSRAEAVARATAPNGQVQDGDGYCSADESRFADERGRQKLENDLRATATTRAKNRAIADLVGMGEVSAEEVAVGGGSGAPVEAPEETKRLASEALTLMVGDVEAARECWGAIKQAAGGSMPAVVAEALLLVQVASEQVKGEGA